MIESSTATSVDEDYSDDGHRLISSTRIEGTPVFDRRGEKIGSIHALMIDKQTGQVAHAVLTFGGILGFGSRAYPLPWSMLRYDPSARGYGLDLLRADIEEAPYMTLDGSDRPRRSQEPAYRYWDTYL